MTSKNLFKIRHPCFNNYRSLQFERSLNNYSQFCRFFDLDEHKSLEDSEVQERKKFSQYKFLPVEMIEQEMAITDNIFYDQAYG